MNQPPHFEPDPRDRIRRVGWIMIGAIVAVVAAVLLVGSCGSDREKGPVAVPYNPGQAQKDSQATTTTTDPTAQPSAGDSSEDYAKNFEVKGSRTLTVTLTDSGIKPQTVQVYLGDKIRFLNKISQPMRLQTSESNVPWSFESGMIEKDKSRIIIMRGLGRATYISQPVLKDIGGEVNKTKPSRGVIVIKPRK